MDPLFQGSLVNARRIIYTPSDFAKNNLLHLQEAGELQALKPHTSKEKGAGLLPVPRGFGGFGNRGL